MSGISRALAEHLAPRYRVDHELGRGGMATVYLAQDLRHDRRVALKVLRSDTGSSGSAERFLREIQTVAKLHHPHVLSLFDSGSVGNDFYYVMPFVDGETLRQSLERRGQLSVEETVRIASDVADALDYAHGQGVVHRDIKPENIFLSGGHALVGDFGVARAAFAAGLNQSLTEAGVAVGTPTYMSPEQAAADPSIDGRSDQYSLGCVVYEMLAGQPPFSGPTSQAVMARHTTDPVPPLSTIRAIPVAMAQAIERALAKAPADRWERSGAFARALRASEVSVSRERARIPVAAKTAAVAAVAMLIVLGFIKYDRGRNGNGSPQIPLVAVLPFGAAANEQSAMAEGITDGVAAALVQIPGIGVLYGGNVAAYQADRSDPRIAGEELGATAVLTANLRSSGRSFWITAQLTDVRSGRTLWLKRFDGELASSGRVQDVFSIQDAITTQIVGSLLPQLQVAGRPHARTVDSVAYQLLLEARRTAEESSFTEDVPLRLVEQALLRDSTYLDAWITLADAILLRGILGVARPADVSIRTRRALERAIQLDPNDGRAFNIRALIRANYDWDLRGAITDGRRAVQLAPGSSVIASDYSALLAFVAQHDSAIVHARKAVALNPRSAQAWSQLGNRFAFAGMRDSAISAGERSISLDSRFWPSYWLLMNGYRSAGRTEEADRAAERMMEYSSDEPAGLVLAATYYGKARRADAARNALSRISHLAQTRYVAPSTIGAARLATGDRDGALALLEESAANHDFALLNDFTLSYGDLKGDPRYEAVRKKIWGDVPTPRHPWQ